MLNYRIATNTVKTAVFESRMAKDCMDRACFFSYGRNETIYHLFLECDLKAYAGAIKKEIYKAKLAIYD